MLCFFVDNFLKLSSVFLDILIPKGFEIVGFDFYSVEPKYVSVQPPFDFGKHCCIFGNILFDFSEVL